MLTSGTYQVTIEGDVLGGGDDASTRNNAKRQAAGRENTTADRYRFRPRSSGTASRRVGTSLSGADSDYAGQAPVERVQTKSWVPDHTRQ